MELLPASSGALCGLRLHRAGAIVLRFKVSAQGAGQGHKTITHQPARQRVALDRGGRGPHAGATSKSMPGLEKEIRDVD